MRRRGGWRGKMKKIEVQKPSEKIPHNDRTGLTMKHWFAVEDVADKLVYHAGPEYTLPSYGHWELECKRPTSGNPYKYTTEGTLGADREEMTMLIEVEHEGRSLERDVIKEVAREVFKTHKSAVPSLKRLILATYNEHNLIVEERLE